MGVAVLELAPPASRNATPARSTRGAGLGRHKAKRAYEADLARLLLAAGVPRPIPGDRARASAHLLFPTPRRRDEGNYRDGLEKALGDALSPDDAESPFRWLTDDTPEHFTFGTVTFGQTEVGWNGKRKPAVAIVTLAWGQDLVEQLRAELELLEAVTR